MEVITVRNVIDILCLSEGTLVSKRNLYDLIVESKVQNSRAWIGNEYKVNNTPQQGINWVGDFGNVKAVIVKTRPGRYSEDKWLDEENSRYRYSFKAREGIVNQKEKANQVLINQLSQLYPILLFSEQKENWKYWGKFKAESYDDKTITIIRESFRNDRSAKTIEIFEDQFYEGKRRIVKHTITERSRKAVEAAKKNASWNCEICNTNIEAIFGVKYIEAHHIEPVSISAGEHEVKISDFALLCPTCHKVVHIFMKDGEENYGRIKSRMKELIQN